MTDSNHTNHSDDGKPVTGDRLDGLLRSWHDENKVAAHESQGGVLRAAEREALLGTADESNTGLQNIVARIGFLRLASMAALLVCAFTLIALFMKNTEKKAFAEGEMVQVAEGGALDALDDDGNTLGPCPLQHTDVKVEISGLFARTVVEQTYANPYPRTIEAVYTFPLSNRAAVDRMTMIVRSGSGEKVIEGEVKERALARAMYEEARESGYVASLLEQERPNIFTQSVANIEPGATVKVRIATIELATRKNGLATYAFPMVVGPRYIPGAPASMPTLPEGWEVRQGVVLRAPAGVELATEAVFSATRMTDLLERATPVRAAKNETIDQVLSMGEGISFTANYGNGSAERGVYFAAVGIGQLNGRFFFSPLGKDQGTGFSGDTTQVPDASRITPMPTKPSERAGHDISLTVTIDSGGPSITGIISSLHEVNIDETSRTTRVITLSDMKTIPNRDFIVHWSVGQNDIEPAFFAHVNDSADASVKGGYFALLVEPPTRVAPTAIRPRELIFVLDVSGSMNGFPIEKSKALARKAIAAMRATDTFNFITFAGATSVLWSEPRMASDENRKLADDFVNGAYGAGGTEMMTAINAALIQDGRSGLAPAKLLDLPADGRQVRVAVPHNALVAATSGSSMVMNAGVGSDGVARVIPVDLAVAIPANPKGLALLVDGTWETRDGNRIFAAKSAKFEEADARTRFVLFLTDGYIGNDQAVVQAVRDNARASRVMSFGIGNSVNRFLLEEMARAGRGTCEVVTLSEDADAVIDRLVRHIDSPVLTDIELDIPDGLGMRALLPAGDHLPDLFDQEPIVLLGRFDRANSGVITVRGRTGAGAWEREIRVDLPAQESKHDVVPTLWARAQVDELLLPKLAAVESETLDLPTKRAVIRLGESFHIATPYTSFIAVEKSRVTVGGKAMLVSVPVELPDGTNWACFFGEGVRPYDAIIAESRRSGARDITRAESSEALRSYAESFVVEAVKFGVVDLDAEQGEAENLGETFELSDYRTRQPIVQSGSNVAVAPSAGTSTALPPTSSPPPIASAPPGALAPPNAASASVNEAGKRTQTQGRREDSQLQPPGRGARRETIDSGGGIALGGGGGGGFAKGPAPTPPANSPAGVIGDFSTAAGPSGGLGGSGGAIGPGGGANNRGLDRGKIGESAEKAATFYGRASGLGGGTSAGETGGKKQDAKEGLDKSKLSSGDEARDSAREPSARQGETIVDQLGTTGANDGAIEVTAASTTKPALTAGNRDRLVRVVERRLVLVALAALMGNQAVIPSLIEEFALPAQGSGATISVRVAIKVTTDANGAIDVKLLDSLRALGVTIDGEDASRGLVVANMPPQAIIRSALLAGVSRIEPLASSIAE